MTVQRRFIMLVLCICIGLLTTGTYAKPAAATKPGAGSKVSQPVINEECEKRVPSSYTAAQKRQLCTAIEGSAGSVNSIGPAICASVAKQVLHGSPKFETILQLCQGASSAAPVQCYEKMEATGSALRNNYALDLCARAESTLPGECFADINGYSGTTNKVKPEVLSEFCRSLVDRAPLLCVQAVKDTGLLPVPQALAECALVLGSGDSKDGSEGNTAAADCITAMQPQVKPSFGVTAVEVLKFCVGANPRVYEDHELSPSDAPASTASDGKSPPAECFILSAHITQSATTGSVSVAEDGPASSPLLTPKQRLALCANAHTALGPINCTTSALSRGGGGRGPDAALNTGLRAAEVVELCQGAQNPGPAQCFVAARGLGSTADKTHLCNGAFSSGPAHCYRRAGSVFRNDVGNQTLLCVSAVSEDPAICAAAAPHYLSVSEKVDLCSGAPPSRGQDPVRCLNAVAAAAKEFRNGPKKALGYFLESLWEPRDRKSRALLVHLCSFGGSQDPIASATCFQSAPNSLDHDDAARMCTDIPSTEVIEHMQLCHRLLPRDWGSEEASVLCEETTGREQVEAALRCAVEASTRMMFPKLSKLHAAQVCAKETRSGPVLACLREVSKGVSASSPSAYLATPDSVVTVCSAAATVTGQGGSSAGAGAGTGDRHSRGRGALNPATSANGIHPGQCLAKLAGLSSSKMILDSAVPPYLCAQQDPYAILTCLESLHKRMVSVDDVSGCINTKQEVKSVRVKRILTEDNGIEIMAGKRFSLWLELLDQYGRRFADPQQTHLFSASLNANNPQGAVLWGIRSNYSSPVGDGLLQLNSLVISQPGLVDFKISVSIRTHSGTAPSAASTAAAASAKPQLIEMFRLDVAEDPIVSQAAPCIYVLQQTQCPVGANTAAEWESEFPRTRSYTPADSTHYLRNLHCAGHGLDDWHVGAYLSADGGLWVEYRVGIDSLWTGVGMPKMEQSPLERLGLFASDEGVKSLDASADGENSGKRGGRGDRKRERAAQKEIRRAYYRKSLQWHPDRWAGLGMYQLAVQGAFELINEAYNALTGGAGNGTSGTSAEEEETPAPEPVYD